MGKKHIDGDNVPADPVKAFEWYLKAVKQFMLMPNAVLDVVVTRALA